MHVLILSLLVACGGEEPKPAPVAAPEPPKPAAAPAPTPAPPPAAAAPAPTPTGPYTPDDLAAAAYTKAKEAGADKMDKNPKAGDAAAIAAGKTQYDQKCASCHGTAGDANTPVGQALPQKPSNFHHKERWDHTTIGVKHWIVLNGIAGTGMAPVGLNDDQAWEVLAYVESEFVGK